MAALEVEFSPLAAPAADRAGALWRQHRRGRPRGSGRTRVVADFLVGAHALLRADALLTRDRGFYREYFQLLRLLAPAAA